MRNWSKFHDLDVVQWLHLIGCKANAEMAEQKQSGTEQLWRVETKRYVAAFVTRDAKVIEAAPILRKQLMGRALDVALTSLSNRGCKVESVV